MDARRKPCKTLAMPAAGQTFRNGCANHVDRWSKLREVIFSETNQYVRSEDRSWIMDYGSWIKIRNPAGAPKRDVDHDRHFGNTCIWKHPAEPRKKKIPLPQLLKQLIEAACKTKIREANFCFTSLKTWYVPEFFRPFFAIFNRL